VPILAQFALDDPGQYFSTEGHFAVDDPGQYFSRYMHST